MASWSSRGGVFRQMPEAYCRDLAEFGTQPTPRDRGRTRGRYLGSPPLGFLSVLLLFGLLWPKSLGMKHVGWAQVHGVGAHGRFHQHRRPVPHSPCGGQKRPTLATHLTLLYLMRRAAGSLHGALHDLPSFCVCPAVQRSRSGECPQLVFTVQDFRSQVFKTQQQ